MLLPIIFKRRSRYSTYRSSSYHSPYRRRQGRGRRGCAAVVALAAMFVAALWALWHYWPLTQEEQKACHTRVIMQTRYVICCDTTAVMTFTATKGDTLLQGINGVTAKGAAAYVSDTVGALWVRQWEMLPYNGRNIVVEESDTAAICRMRHGDITRLLQRQLEHNAASHHIAAAQQVDVDYYLRTHTVLDNGFDIVARYSKTLARHDRELRTADSLIRKALQCHTLAIRMDRRYYTVNDSTGQLAECMPYKHLDGLLQLTAADNGHQPSATSRLISKDKARAVLKALHHKKTRQPLSAIDSIGDYSGERDSVAMPHGYGRLMTEKGEYYEGEWQHGHRSGVGFSIVPGQRLRMGEWKDDRYLGERVAYTPERIYGIDISKHQHEKGRRRYAINWRNLRITSLGKKSKKVIHGTVDYPVRFVFIKATEGVTVRNRYFASDYAAARKNGYRVGAYHFYSVKTPARQQANNFLRNSRYTKGDLPPVLDLEPTDAQIRKAGGIHALFRSVRQWLNTVETQRGVRPILYISQRFVNRYLSMAPDLQKNYDVWIARYGEYKPDVNLVYWQLSPDGRVNGIHGDVDINVYNGFNF